MKGLCICICAVSCITGIVLLILGFSSLEATEWGLDYSWISKTVDPTVRENGLYFIGIGHSFYKFPRNVQTIEFSRDRNANRYPIESRTSDGLEVVLEISFQYVLQPENLYKLFNLYGEHYQNVFSNMAVDLLTEEATKYTAYDFFMDRGKIKEDFQTKLNQIYNAQCYSTIQFLQLRAVELPTLFEAAIQESEVKKQDIQKAYAELNKVKVEVDTKIKSADFQKNVTINIAEGEADALLKQNNATIDSLVQVQNTQTQAYTNLKNNLGLSNAALLNFVKAKLIKNYDGKDMALNMKAPDSTS